MPPRCWTESDSDGCRGVSALDFVSLMVLFWYTTLLEVPRYVIGAIALSQPSRNAQDSSPIPI